VDAGQHALAAANRFDRLTALAAATPPRAPAVAASGASAPAATATDTPPPAAPATASTVSPATAASTGSATSAAATPAAAAPREPASREPAPAPTAAAVVATALEREQPLIKQTLARYRAAYHDHSIDGLLAIFPDIPREERQKLEKAFKDASKNCRAYEVLQGDPTIFVTGADATDAQVTVQSSYSCTPVTGQRDQVASMRDVFVMKKINGAWLITRMGALR
jgi:hypothetical protein